MVHADTGTDTADTGDNFYTVIIALHPCSIKHFPHQASFLCIGQGMAGISDSLARSLKRIPQHAAGAAALIRGSAAGHGHQNHKERPSPFPGTNTVLRISRIT